MKWYISVFLVGILLSCTNDSLKVMGNKNDRGDSSISGVITYEGSEYDDTLTVSLYKQRNEEDALLKSADPVPVDEVITVDGIYEFTDLAEGAYDIRITCDGIQVGEETSIPLGRYEKKKVSTEVIVVINQVFNIYIDQSSTNTVNIENIAVSEGSMEITNGSGNSGGAGEFTASFLETADSLLIEVRISDDGEEKTVPAWLIKMPDGSFEIELIGSGTSETPVKIEKGECKRRYKRKKCKDR